MEDVRVDRCVPNISAVEREKRLAFGFVSLTIGLIALVGLIAVEFNPWWRLALFPVFAGAASGYFQWRDMT
jgi:hypothetical protein